MSSQERSISPAEERLGISGPDVNPLVYWRRHHHAQTPPAATNESDISRENELRDQETETTLTYLEGRAGEG
jgi:hypothetical protein